MSKPGRKWTSRKKYNKLNSKIPHIEDVPENSSTVYTIFVDDHLIIVKSHKSAIEYSKYDKNKFLVSKLQVQKDKIASTHLYKNLKGNNYVAGFNYLDFDISTTLDYIEAVKYYEFLNENIQIRTKAKKQKTTGTATTTSPDVKLDEELVYPQTPMELPSYQIYPPDMKYEQSKVSI